MLEAGEQVGSKARAEVVPLLAITVVTAGAVLTVINFGAHPHEDAAILMRYADHFANGHGLVWNIGDDPVDGATDFLFTA